VSFFWYLELIIKPSSLTIDKEEKQVLGDFDDDVSNCEMAEWNEMQVRVNFRKFPLSERICGWCSDAYKG